MAVFNRDKFGFTQIPGQPVARFSEETGFDEPRFQQLLTTQGLGAEPQFRRQRESIQNLFRRRGLGAGSGLEAEALGILGGEQTAALQRGATSIFDLLSRNQQASRTRVFEGFLRHEGALGLASGLQEIQSRGQRGGIIGQALGGLASTFLPGVGGAAGAAVGVAGLFGGRRTNQFTGASTGAQPSRVRFPVRELF